MLSKFSVLASLLAVATALQIQVPEEPTSDGEITIRWTPEAGDPNVISLQLTNEAFHDTYGIANNVPTADGELTLTLPTLQPGSGYTIVGNDISDINHVYGQSAEFSIGASTSTSATASTSSSASTTSRASSSASTTAPPLTSPSTSGFGTTVQNTTPVSSSSTGASAEQTVPNAASISVKFETGNVFMAAAAVLGGLAGAAVVAL